MKIFRPFITVFSMACAGIVSLPSTSSADEAYPHSVRPASACRDFVLSCENGREFPFCVRAITADGDVVTGTLFAGRHAVKMRLIPMGIGYRYAGPGIWFDGFQDNASIYFRNDASMACTVSSNPANPAGPFLVRVKD